MVVLRCNVRFTLDVDPESVCMVTLVLPLAKVLMTPDEGFAETIGMVANKLETINNARITERVALKRSGSREGGILSRTITGG